MKVSRRNILQITGIGIVVAGAFPRMAFAARNSIKSMRTGVQPGNKTRFVVETANRPSYTLVYGENTLTVKLSNTPANDSVKPKLASGTLVRNVSQTQIGDSVNIVLDLKKPVAEIPKNQIMVLEPNGDNDYRLVLDFVAGTTKANAATAQSTADTANSNANSALSKFSSYYTSAQVDQKIKSSSSSSTGGISGPVLNRKYFDDGWDYCCYITYQNGVVVSGERCGIC